MKAIRHIDPSRLVFRLRKCPSDIDSRALRILLSEALGDISAQDVQIQSLAGDYGVCSTTKTATLMFRKLPDLIKNQPKQAQWRISVDGVVESSDGSTENGLLLNTHFQGLTPLNDVEPCKHEFE